MFNLYMSKANTMVNAPDERLTDYVLQSNSLNFSSLYPNMQLDCSGFAYGEPNNKKTVGKKEPKPNPMFDFRNDGFLFVINTDYTKIELLIIENERYTIKGYLKKLVNGELDEALQQMRATAKPFFNY